MPRFFRFDEFELDGLRLELRCGGVPVKVDALVLRLLACLVRRPGSLVTKEEIVAEVWSGRAVADNVLTVSMARLRKALGHSRGGREFVATAYGRGYRFVREVVVVSAEAVAASGPGLGPAAEPPFVGRERVLKRLRDAFGCARDGRGRMCALIGEPGIGKTRAVEVLQAELAGSDVGFAWGFCHEAVDTPPLWPWLRLLRQVSARCGSAELERSLGSWGAEIHALLHDNQDEAGKRDAGDGLEWPQPARFVSREAIVRALGVAAARMPWVLVLDDLHAADAASLEVLNLLIDELAQLRILLVATLRRGEDGRAPRPDTRLPHVIAHRNCERIVLEPLREAEVGAYVAALVPDPNGALGRAVFAKSEGNPFFMVELSRQLQDADGASVESMRIPAPALELVRQRIERLAGETHRDLAAAAVIGRAFDLPLLAAVTQRDPSALMSTLDDALAAEVVIAAPDSATAFAFGHALLQTMLYDALPSPERRSWHVRVARALEQRLAAGHPVQPSELAYHGHAALPEGDPRKTIAYCRAAASASSAVFANSDVVRYLRHALEALDLLDRPSVRLRMSLLLRIALYGRSQSGEFRSAVRELVRLAREHGDGPILVQAACMLTPHLGMQPVPGAAEALEHAIALLPPDEERVRSVAIAMLACVSPVAWSAAQSHALLEEALISARRCADPIALRTALGCYFYVHGGSGQPRMLEVEAELQQIARRCPKQTPVLPAELAFARAVSALQRGDERAVSAALETVSVRCRELRHDELLWHSRRCQALMRINVGAWSEGVAALDALHRDAERQQILGTDALCAFDRAVIASELSEPPPLDDGLRSALAYAACEPPSIWALKLRALATLGLDDEARSVLRIVTPSQLRELPADRDFLGTLGHVVRAALLLGELEYAEAAAESLLPHRDRFAGHVSFLCEGSVLQLVGMVDCALGRQARAIANLGAGIRLNDRHGFALRAAEARLQLCEVLRAAGGDDQRARALALARRAGVSAARLGLPRLVRTASSLARATAVT